MSIKRPYHRIASAVILCAFISWFFFTPAGFIPDHRAQGKSLLFWNVANGHIDPAEFSNFTNSVGADVYTFVEFSGKLLDGIARSGNEEWLDKYDLKLLPGGMAVACNKEPNK